ncbi:integrase core domain-containing protein, partial [Burkholderia cepacia]|uniref:integrase core domain-containing protein n=1 Tax=Burkholderia cepacia TaxID=292 RepID=UPI0018C766AF
LLHVRLLLRERTLLDSGWPCLQGAGQSQYHWEDLDHVQRFAPDWMWTYNHDRPHVALGGFTPTQRPTMAA